MPPPLSSAGARHSRQHCAPTQRGIREQRTRRAEQDDAPRHRVALERSFERKRDGDACGSDEIVSARVSDARERIHLCLQANRPPAVAIREFGAPRGVEPAVVPRDGEAARGEKRSEHVVRVAVDEYNATSCSGRSRVSGACNIQRVSRGRTYCSS